MANPAPKVPYAADLTGRRLGRYEVLSLLASGGMATVYIARAQGVAGFERLVAIKVLHPHLAHDEDFISMFLDEARLAARIRHPNVVGTLDISDTEGDGYFLVMEYVEGDHFGALLRNAARGQERLPVPVVARILMDALSGLHAAHTLTDGSGQPLDLVHRDVSPHNILVGLDGVARITDFGVAKAQVRLSSTRDGQFKGKLSYMAPEQAASGEADQRSDLFSMGIVLWEALTGRRLFRGENNADVLNKVLNADVPALSSFDPQLAPFDAVASGALAKDPEERYSTAEEFIVAIEDAAAALSGVATPRAVAREVKRWLGEKVAAERQTVTTAIDAMGRSELQPGVLPRPMESGSQPSVAFPREAPGSELTMGAKPSTLAFRADEDERGRRPLVWIGAAAVVALFLLGGGVAAWMLMTPDARSPDAAPPTAVAPPPQPAAPIAGATEDVEAPRDEAAEAADDDESEASAEAEADESEALEAADEPAARPTRPRRGRGRRRAPPRSGGDEDDGIIVNPYRR